MVVFVITGAAVFFLSGSDGVVTVIDEGVAGPSYSSCWFLQTTVAVVVVGLISLEDIVVVATDGCCLW